MTKTVAESLGFVSPYGAIFETPKPKGPAAAAGIEAGDVVTTINGTPLSKSEDFEGVIARFAPGSVIYLTTLRDGELFGPHDHAQLRPLSKRIVGVQLGRKPDS